MRLPEFAQPIKMLTCDSSFDKEGAESSSKGSSRLEFHASNELFRIILKMTWAIHKDGCFSCRAHQPYLTTLNPGLLFLNYSPPSKFERIRIAGVHLAYELDDRYAEGTWLILNVLNDSPSDYGIKWRKLNYCKRNCQSNY